MIRWLLKNKEWVFGGVGVVALSAGLKAIFSIFGVNEVTPQPETPTQIIQIQEAGDSSPNVQINGQSGDVEVTVPPPTESVSTPTSEQ